jgi:hypothetical protein
MGETLGISIPLALLGRLADVGPKGVVAQEPLKARLTR